MGSPAWATPGFQAPGNQAPGNQAPGNQAPGNQAPGNQAPGVQAPGVQAPGVQAPGNQAPGNQAPGVQAPGLQAPGVQAPGVQAPGNQAPGLQGPGTFSEGTQAIFPDSVPGLYIGGFDSESVYQASYWTADQAWIQFINTCETPDHPLVLLGDGSYDCPTLPGASGPQYAAWLNGVPYQRYISRNGRLELQNWDPNVGDFVTLVGGVDVAGAELNALVLSATQYSQIIVRVGTAMVDWSTTTIPAARPNPTHNPADQTYYPTELTLDGNQNPSFTTNFGADDHLRYRLEVFGALSADGSDGAWHNICGDNDVSDNDGTATNAHDASTIADAGSTNIFTSNFGLLLSGTIVHYSGDYKLEGMTYACDGGTATKAIRVFGYQPWNRFDDPNNGDSRTHPEETRPFGEIAWTSAMRGLMADYCENNVGLTKAGTFIDLYDFRGLNGPYVPKFSATWYDCDGTYCFGGDSKFTTSDDWNTATLDCTGDMDHDFADAQNPASLPEACGGVVSILGSNGDVREVSRMRYIDMKQYASCNPTSFWPLGATRGDATPFEYQFTDNSIEIRSSTVCDHPLTRTGKALASDCGMCPEWGLKLNGRDPYCVDGDIPGHTWDSVCVDYADGDGINDEDLCVGQANMNATVAWVSGGGGAELPTQAGSISTDLDSYEIGQSITATWSGIAAQEGDYVAIASAHTIAGLESNMLVNVISGDDSHTFSFTTAECTSTSELPGGDYVVRYVRPGSPTPTILAQSRKLRVAMDWADPSLEIDQTPDPVRDMDCSGTAGVPGNYAINCATDKIHVKFKNLPICNNCYVGILDADRAEPADTMAANAGKLNPDTRYAYNYQAYAYVGYCSSGLRFEGLLPGRYIARFYYGDTNNRPVIDSQAFVIGGGPGSPSVSVTTGPGTATVTFDGIVASMYDYLTIATPGQGAEEYTACKDASGTPQPSCYRYVYTLNSSGLGENANMVKVSSNQVVFSGLAPGTYEARYIDSSTSPGTIYSVGSVEARSAQFTITIPPPATPTGLAATTSPTQVSLTWNASADADSYSLTRTPAFATAVTGLTGTSFVDTTVTAGTAYTYKVSATNLGGTSALSANSNSVTPLRPAPTTFTATGFSQTQINLSWSAVSGATGYTVTRSTTSNGTYAACTCTVTGTTATNTGLTAGQTFFYKVKATNSGTLSAAVSGTSLPAAPAAPTGLAVTPGNIATASQMVLTWTAVTGATGYKVFRGTTQVAGGTVSTLTGTTFTDGTGTPAVASALAANTSYSYTVKAVNAGGDSAASAAVAKTTAPAKPATPTTVAGAAGSKTITVNWTAVTGAGSYKVYRSSGTATGTKTLVYTTPSAGPVALTFANTGLTAGTTYFYFVTSRGGTTAAPTAESNYSTNSTGRVAP